MKQRAERNVADPPIAGDWAWPPATARTEAAPRSAHIDTRIDPELEHVGAPPPAPAAAAPRQQRIVMSPREVAAVVHPPVPRPAGVWTRLRRSLFGEPNPVFED